MMPGSPGFVGTSVMVVVVGPPYGTVKVVNGPEKVSDPTGVP